MAHVHEDGTMIANPKFDRDAIVRQWAETLPVGEALVMTTGGKHQVTIIPNGAAFLGLCHTCPFIGLAEDPMEAAELLYGHVRREEGA